MAERGASGGSEPEEGRRGYSGSGGHVVNYKDLESLDVDHYDFINAPQYVDFSDLSKSDDPNADLFFETHREEDDFMISIDNISPTVQLLSLEQQKLLSDCSKEATEAAAKSGMDDVKVEYYDSPTSTKQGIKNTSFNSSICSFYTPAGSNYGSGGHDSYDYEEEFEDKENCPPSAKDPVKKLSYSAALNGSSNNCDYKTGGERALSEQTNNKFNYSGKHSLMNQFEKCQILSSDDEVDEEDTFIELSVDSYESPTKSIQADEEFVNAILKTPGTILTNEEPNPIISSESSEFYEEEEYFEEVSNRTLSPSKPMPISSIKENTEGETVTILEIHQENEAEEEFLKNEFPVFQGPGSSDHEKSALKLLDNSEHHENLLKAITLELNEAISKEIIHDNKVTHVKTNTTNMTMMKPKQQWPYPPSLKVKHYVSLAEAVRKFHKDTPERFHSLPRGRGNEPVTKTHTGFFPLKPTIPHPFHFSTTRQRPVLKQEEFKFKARPAPKTNGGGGFGTQRPESKGRARASSTNTDHRKEPNVRKTQSATQSPQSSVLPSHFSQSKSARVAGTKQTPVANNEPHKITSMKPFSFDQRNQDMLRKKEEKLKQLEAEKQRLREMAIFHAHPASVIYKPAFAPELPSRTLEFLDIHLYTEKRAAKREEFDKGLREKELEDERRFAEEQVRLEEQRRKEEIELRRQLVHKAQPFKIPKPFECKASFKPLTVPQSPAFARRSPTKKANTSL